MTFSNVWCMAETPRTFPRHHEFDSTMRVVANGGWTEIHQIQLVRGMFEERPCALKWKIHPAFGGEITHFNNRPLFWHISVRQPFFFGISGVSFCYHRPAATPRAMIFSSARRQGIHAATVHLVSGANGRFFWFHSKLHVRRRKLPHCWQSSVAAFNHILCRIVI